MARHELTTGGETNGPLPFGVIDPNLISEYERSFLAEILQNYLNLDPNKFKKIDFISLYSSTLRSGAGDTTHPDHPDSHTPKEMPPEAKLIINATSSKQLFGTDEIDLGIWVTKHPLFQVTDFLEKDGIVYRVFEQIPSTNKTPEDLPILAVTYVQDENGLFVPNGIVKLSDLL